MSKYTTEVRFICEQQSGLEESKGYNDVGQIIESARTHIFDFPYPIFSNEYKPVLESKILMHYYTREISEETYGLWKLRLRARMNEIMPYYNKLYESELIEFNPLWDTDLSTDRDIQTDNTHEDETVTDNTTVKTTDDSLVTDGRDVVTLGGEDVSTIDGQDVSATTGQDVSTLGGEDVSRAGGTDTNSATRNDVNNEWDLYSDTPQGSIKGIQGAEDDPSLGDNGYLTNARHTFGDTQGSTSSGSTVYGRTDTMDYGRTDTTEYGKTNTTDIDRSNTVEYGKTTTTDYGKSSTLESDARDKFDGNVTTDGTSSDTVDFFERVTGYRGRNASESILKFRETFLNIDMMIIKELRDLFFNLW